MIPKPDKNSRSTKTGGEEKRDDTGKERGEWGGRTRRKAESEEKKWLHILPESEKTKKNKLLSWKGPYFYLLTDSDSIPFPTFVTLW